MHLKMFLRILLIICIFTGCKKDAFQKYEGDFKIKVMLVHPDHSYFVASGDSTKLNLYFNGNQHWNFSRVNGNQFIIAATENPEIVFFTNDFGGIELAHRSQNAAPTRTYFTIEETEKQSIAIKSVYNSKYLYVPYCEKNGDTWAYDVNLIADRTTCLAESAGADTCYCVSSFLLEK